MPPIVETINLTRSYGARRGIENVSLAIEPGTLFGFLGPNGAGKTTTIRVLLGFLRATSGAARVFERNCWRDAHHIKRDVGYLPGDLRLWSWITGSKALRIVSAVRGIDITSRGNELAERLGLEMDVRARAMSRGMRQKLGLILALAHEPKLLILDEPTSGLDPIVQRALQRYLRELADRGHTVFFSSHTLSEVEQLCDRVAIIRDGIIVEDSTVDALRAQAARQVTIRWRDAPPDPSSIALDGLTLSHRTGDEWRGELHGDSGELLRRLAALNPADVTIEAPDLEEVFHGYYEEDAGASDA